MSTNAAQRTTTTVPPTRRQVPATILHLPVAGQEMRPSAETGLQPAPPSVRRRNSRGDMLVSVLLAILLVLACFAWEALSGGL